MTAPGWREAWTDALDALETDVTVAEALLDADHRQRDIPPADLWSPPQGLGPLPLDLRPRADQILARQLAAADALARGIAMNRKQSQLSGRIEAGSDGRSRPAYLDCAM